MRNLKDIGSTVQTQCHTSAGNSISLIAWVAGTSEACFSVSTSSIGIAVISTQRALMNVYNIIVECSISKHAIVEKQKLTYACDSISYKPFVASANETARNLLATCVDSTDWCTVTC